MGEGGLLKFQKKETTTYLSFSLYFNNELDLTLILDIRHNLTSKLNRYDQLTQKTKPITGKANVSCANCCRVIGVEYVIIFDFILNFKLLEMDLNSITLYEKHTFI